MHSGNPHIDYDLLMLFLTKEAAPQQIKEVEEWLSKAEENQKTLDELEKLWIETGKITPPPVAVNTGDAWNKVFSKIQAEENKPITLKVEPQKGNNVFSSFVRIAAIFLILLGGYGVFKLVNKDVAQVTLLSAEASMQKALPDSSKVEMKMGAKITYPEKFKGKTREVTLEGEAYFSVAKNKERPFVIHTEIADITVLGTTFNVKAEPNTNTVEVIVETGVVRLTDNTMPNNASKSLTLEAGTSGTIDRNTGEIKKINRIDENKLVWKTNRMVFKNSKLTDVFTLLSEHFNVSIQLENQAIKNCLLTVTFENNDIDYILDIIATTLELTYRKENNVYLFEGNGCE